MALHPLGNPATATGTVTFMDGAATLGTVGIAGGKAHFTTSTLTAGAHSIAAVYGGDANFGGSTSPAHVQTVKKAATTTALVSSLESIQERDKRSPSRPQWLRVQVPPAP
jgi:Big-like domain-containing protein